MLYFNYHQKNKTNINLIEFIYRQKEKRDFVSLVASLILIQKLTDPGGGHKCTFNNSTCEKEHLKDLLYRNYV